MQRALASSRIEEVWAPAADVAMAAVDLTIVGAAGWVAGNLRTVSAAAAHGGPLTTEDLWAWHRLLMAHGDLEEALVASGGTALAGSAAPHPTTPPTSRHRIS